MDDTAIKNFEDIVQLTAFESFECEHCGYCCRKCEPIVIEVSDIIRIASFLKKPLKVIKRKYIKQHPTYSDKLALKKTNPCHFYDFNSKSCKIYQVRPRICREYPILTTEDFSLAIECNASVKLIENTRLFINEMNRITSLPDFERLRAKIQENPELMKQAKEMLKQEHIMALDKAKKKLEYVVQ
jgi:Fe-S-cluster containining protein